MKKVFAVIIGLSILLFAAVAFARPWGACQNTADLSAEQKQFFDATKDLRKEMHDKRFQLMELNRSGADKASIDALEKDLDAIRTKIQAKAQESGISSGFGACGNQRADCYGGRGCGPGWKQGCNGGGPCADQQAFNGCGRMMGRFAR
jgi:hypothetical protein